MTKSTKKWLLERSAENGELALNVSSIGVKQFFTNDPIDADDLLHKSQTMVTL